MAVANSTFSHLVQFLPSSSQWNWNSSAKPAIAAFVVIFISASFLCSTKPESDKDKIHDLDGISVLTAWNFFKKPFNFFQGHFKETGGEMFRSRVLQVSSKLLPPSQLLTSHRSIE